jgi:mRNA interferase MazF
VGIDLGRWLAFLMRRGEIRVVNFDRGRGSEATKRRPAVIVSNDGANAVATRLGRGVITVVPITSNIRRIYPFQVRLAARSTGLRQDSKAQAEQIRSVTVERLGEHVGTIPAGVMLKIDEALRLHLAL